MRSICTSAFIPPWAISLQPSLKANGGSSKPSRPPFTKHHGICVQPDGGSTISFLAITVKLKIFLSLRERGFMKDNQPWPFWHQNIGPYNTELSLLYSEIQDFKDTKEILKIISHHLLTMPVYANAESPRLRYRAYLMVMTDLLRQSWKCECRQGRIFLTPPSWTESAKDPESVQKQKAAIRATLDLERQAQLKKPSVQEFIRKMERKQLFRGQLVSILSVYADGTQLADDLKAILGSIRK